MRIYADPGAPDVIVKEADSEGDRRRLGREAAILRAAAHPGVVGLLSSESSGRPEGPDRLRLRRATGSPLHELGPDQSGCEPRSPSEWGAAAATVLADLHDLGYCHRAVRAEHIIVDEQGRPVLCGFGSAGPLDEASAAADASALVGLILERTDPSERRLERALRRWAGPPPSGAARLVRSVAGPGRATDARTLARILAEAASVGFNGEPGGRGPADHPTSSRLAPTGGSTLWRAVVLLAAGAALGLGGWSWVHSGQPPGAPALPVPTYLIQASVGEHPLAVVGRWACGTARPAVLDLATGQVWIYPSLPGSGARSRGRPAGTYRAAAGLAAVGGAGGCDRLLVLGPGGTLQEVGVP
ncbi:MAG TPA: hypothetical protein VKI19_07160 [Acidimicrobiales bacterium]|nr:hypothetical protein [Acidimicrobiales bacterium]